MAVDLRGALVARALRPGDLGRDPMALAPRPGMFTCRRGGVESRILAFGSTEGFSGVYTVYTGEYRVEHISRQPASTGQGGMVVPD